MPIQKLFWHMTKQQVILNLKLYLKHFKHVII